MKNVSLGVAALLPMMIGPLQQDAKMMFVSICDDAGDRIIAVPLSDGEEPMQGPCDSKGCHGAPCRKRLGEI